ncbi:MAG: DivIVA domain-containing protein [Myxococcales bacterium]|nr:DivIVA domain-containing protein [Myxococcales bacterium]
MKITPLEVDQQQFQRVFRGCDPEQVHTFLDLVSREMEELIRENNQFKEDLRRRDQQLAEFRANEAQLREALVSAGRMTDEIKEGARKEAELIRAEAELRAEKIVANAQEQVVRLADETQALRRQKARLLAELRGVLDGHRRLLETQEELDREAKEARQARREAPR